VPDSEQSLCETSGGRPVQVSASGWLEPMLSLQRKVEGTCEGEQSGGSSLFCKVVANSLSRH
jgi:hypothetical protein